jgi:Uma2 family endonuclease
MPATALLTSEQYLALRDEFDRNGNHVKDELIGGEVVRMPPPSLVHDLIKNKINELLLLYLLDNKQLALQCFVEVGAEVSKHDTFVPDVSVVSQEATVRQRSNPARWSGNRDRSCFSSRHCNPA